MICVIYPMNSSLNINRVPWILEETLSNLTSYVSCKILKEMILLDDLQPHFYHELTQVRTLLCSKNSSRTRNTVVLKFLEWFGVGLVKSLLCNHYWAVGSDVWPSNRTLEHQNKCEDLSNYLKGRGRFKSLF